ITDVSDIEHSSGPQLPLDAEIVVLRIWRSDRWIESSDGASTEGLIRQIDDLRIVGCGELKGTGGQGIRDDVGQRVKRRQGRLTRLPRNESGRADGLTHVGAEVCRKKLRAFVVDNQTEIAANDRFRIAQNFSQASGGSFWIPGETEIGRQIAPI